MSSATTLLPDIISAITKIVGEKGIVTPGDEGPFLSEWRNRWPGNAALIVKPASTQEVSALVKLCAQNKIPITPQGGNTGLVGGQIPFGPEILISTICLNKIRDISPLDNTMTVEAGVTLMDAQNAATSVDRFFPVSIGSEGSCQIGGIISTNAGGVNVLRYGNTRDQILGLEVVLPNGDIWNGLKRLRKDNTGYDLKQLFIGGEGTLGIVTGAVLKMLPRPTQMITAFAGLQSPQKAIELLALVQNATGGLASSFELLSRICIDLTTQNIPGVRDPLSSPHPWYVLMEFSDAGNDLLSNNIESVLQSALSQNIIEDATIAQNEKQSQDLWHMRHSMSEAINHEGLGARHDVSVAVADIPAFLKSAYLAVKEIVPDARMVTFGHLGDGNIHYDIIPREGAAKTALDDRRSEIEKSVYKVVAAFNGSISAEHGIGRHKKSALATQKSATELNMMKAIKNALDPDGIMNPNKLIQSKTDEQA